jgi:hypothetical protein
MYKLKEYQKNSIVQVSLFNFHITNNMRTIRTSERLPLVTPQ